LGQGSGLRVKGLGSTIWQSMRSVMPPCPGMVSLKSLILNARLKPLVRWGLGFRD